MADVSIQLRNLDTWSDVNEKIITDTSGNVAISEGVSAVFSSIDNILFTYKGERVMRPEFASKLSGMVFERISDEQFKIIADDIKNTIEQYDDRVVVTAANIIKDVDNLLIGIELWCSIVGYDTPQLYKRVVR